MDKNFSAYIPDRNERNAVLICMSALWCVGSVTADKKGIRLRPSKDCGVVNRLKYSNIMI